MKGKWHVLSALHNRTLFHFSDYIMSVRTAGTRIQLKLPRPIDYRYNSFGEKHCALPEILASNLLLLALAYSIFFQIRYALHFLCVVTVYIAPFWPTFFLQCDTEGLTRFKLADMKIIRQNLKSLNNSRNSYIFFYIKKIECMALGGGMSL